MPFLPDLALHAIPVESTAQLEKLRPAWECLSARDRRATPFQHPAWLIPWWRHVGEGSLLTIALRDGAQLAGLLPMYVYPDAGVRRLFPLGIGTSDYCDALCLPGREAEVMEAGLAALHGLRDRFDVAEIPQLREGSPLLEAAAPGWTCSTGDAEPCPATQLPASFEALRDNVSAKTLRDLRSVRKRAAEAGATWEAATDDTLPELLEALFRLHGARWAMRGEGGVLEDPRVQAMHREAAPLLLRSDLLRMIALRLDGRVVAVLHALADPPGRAGRRLYFYISGFDPGLDRLSPGMLLVGEAIERAIAEGIATADFLRGEERYKSFWGAVPHPTFRRILTPCARC
jgi:CelD/BcsL family acetyltransferase involved in cellulose biosynthesis